MFNATEAWLHLKQLYYVDAVGNHMLSLQPLGTALIYIYSSCHRLRQPVTINCMRMAGAVNDAVHQLSQPNQGLQMILHTEDTPNWCLITPSCDPGILPQMLQKSSFP